MLLLYYIGFTNSLSKIDANYSVEKMRSDYLKIALVYTVEEQRANLPKNEHGTIQLHDTNRNIVEALQSKGHEVIAIPADYKLLATLQQLKPACVFNNCTGIHDKSSQPQIAGLLELSGLPFTGSSQLTHNLALYKPLAKLLMQAAGIPTPQFQVIKSTSDQLVNTLRFPLIVKPEHEGSSIGISNDSIVDNPSDCLQKAHFIINNYHQPALVEEFVSGREFTVGVLGNDKPDVLPFVEIGFKKSSGFYSEKVKSRDGVATICPTEVDGVIKESISKAVLGAYHALECKDYARVDVRLTNNNEPHIIEINTLPGLQAGYSDFPKAAEAAGIDYADLIERIVEMAINRFVVSG